MRIEELLGRIGFNEDNTKQYMEYRSKMLNEVLPFVKGFLSENISFVEALDGIKTINKKELHQYTIDLVFAVECTYYVCENSAFDYISEELFIDSMKDIKYKLEECLKVKNIFGTFVVSWYKKFYTFERVTFGRLQYDFFEYGEDTITASNFDLNKGDFVLNCHIPSSGPLKREDCIESFKMAHHFFKDRLKNGILPVICNSWMLYPPYLEVLGKDSNTGKFARSFEIYSVRETENFDDCWRIFNMDYDGDTKKLPADTTMRRNFISYIENGGTFGTARGILLFDGEKVLGIDNREEIK